MLRPAKKTELQAYLDGREIIDILNDFPAKEITANALVGIMRKLPPRLYSIASSPKAHPGEVHLTVGVVRYDTHGRQRKGVCSTYLSDRIALGDKADVFVTANKHFKIPADNDAPMIMVGPGTGIAPFRAFVEERKAVGAKGQNWLFFGDQLPHRFSLPDRVAGLPRRRRFDQVRRRLLTRPRRKGLRARSHA